MSSSRGCREEFMFNRATATEKDEKKILLKEKTRSCLSPVREEERPSGWRVCLSEETRMKKPALSLKKEGKGELRLLKRTMTMLEEGKRKVDFRGRESKKEMWIEEEGTRGDKEVSSPVHNDRLRITFHMRNTFPLFSGSRWRCRSRSSWCRWCRGVVGEGSKECAE